jgi:protein TonB
MRLLKIFPAGWLLLSAALHLAVLLWLPVSGAFGQVHWTGLPAGSMAGPLQVRLVASIEGPLQLISPAEPPPAPQVPAEAVASAPALRLSTVPDAPPALLLPFVPAPDAAYLRRSELTVPPEPIGAIIIPDLPPAAMAATGPRTFILTLFINEAGLVERIRVETAAIPQAIEEVARRAFEQARFTPGELNGRPVKSSMRIEVSAAPLRQPLHEALHP